ncbi:ABC transporter ATP-binding protein [Flavobacterium degerlachei]|jgi:lipoprotein-releasing system ATP-binding protein|uniref:Lipoprotein-releasing system ATP-binding protein n=1 Tax=Flavobacterium degerlachei TaxID=229203 RepID=A0A1H3F9P5_9FLAO|nr:ABC transporter ATP-binding protein [Flavobacterium degerlachei]SDX87692.1 lipoprotein-releasing system ATP-binding protein [Flavobacterium degerlachei]
MDNNKVIETIGLTKYFYDPVKFQVIKEVDLSINHGEFVSIVGRSGSGKSTLLYLLSTMDTDYEGELYIHNELVTGQLDAQLAKIRSEKIGFVFQFHYLLTEYNVLKNVMLPGLKLGKYSNEELEHRAIGHLKTLGMEKHALKMTNQLSGGEKQRVAIARALINDPLVIMGDEPTGNLDRKNGDLVFDIFKKLTEDFKQTILIVTHDTDFADKTDRIITMEDGRILL